MKDCRIPGGGFAHAEACQHLPQCEQAPVDGPCLLQGCLTIIPGCLQPPNYRILLAMLTVAATVLMATSVVMVTLTVTRNKSHNGDVVISAAAALSLVSVYLWTIVQRCTLITSQSIMFMPSSSQICIVMTDSIKIR